MEIRRLGVNGPSVSSLGLGCAGMSMWYGQRDDAESTATIRRAVELGVAFFDTADNYGPYTNEKLLGAALQGLREDVVIGTKVGMIFGPDATRLGIDGSPRHIREAIDASLTRLGTDYVDLYYLHRVDPQVPIEESVGAMADLVDAGKVRHLGLCEASPATLERAHAIHPIAAVQSEYSLWSREPEDEILPLTRRLGVGFVAYSPLGRGFLTGAIKSTADLTPDDMRRRRFPRFRDDNIQQNAAFVDRLAAIAERKQVRPSQLALAWLLAQGKDVVAIPGTKRRSYLEENVVAADIVLSDEEVAEIAEAVPWRQVAGARKDRMGMEAVGG